MASLLYRLGVFAARHAWAVIGAWVAVLAVTATGFVMGSGTLSSSITLEGTPTVALTQRLAEEFPEASGGTGNIVFHTADDAPLDDAQQQAISTALAGVADLDGVSAVVDPFTAAAQRAAQAEQVEAAKAALASGQAGLDAAQVEATAALLALTEDFTLVSDDGSTAIAVIRFSQPSTEVPAELKDQVRAVVDGTDLPGVEVDFSQELVFELGSMVGAGEIVGVVIAAVVLLTMLGTLVGAGLPLLTALLGVGIAATGTLALSSTIDMVSVTPILGIMLGLAVGIDYALFILNRHRRQLRSGMDLVASIGLANGTSGNAVLFAGMTVVIALVALNVTGIGFLGMMGTVGAVSVAIAVLVALTLTPALLRLAGHRVLRRGERRTPAAAEPAAALAPMRTRSAALRVLAAVCLLGVVAIPSASMRLGLPDGGSEPADSTQHAAYEVTAEKFGAGLNGPLVVIADLPSGSTAESALVAEVSIGEAILAQPGVASLTPIGISEGDDLIAFQVISTDGPATEATEDLVHVLRGLSPQGAEGTLGVAGLASGNIDISEKLSDALPVYLTVVLGLSLLILILVFRSLLVPLIATGGFMLSVFGAFGGVVAVYQWGWLGGVFGVSDPGPILSFLPTILIGVLFGLAMDYQLFLVSGMREAYVHGDSARVAVRHGLHAGRAVVTAAAIIMFSVFGGFAFSHLTMARPIGFGLALGVLLDAFVVRMLLIPAVMHLLGDKAWWLPRWLDRLLPNLDIEGAALERQHHLQG